MIDQELGVQWIEKADQNKMSYLKNSGNGAIDDSPPPYAMKMKKKKLYIMRTLDRVSENEFVSCGGSRDGERCLLLARPPG